MSSEPKKMAILRILNILQKYSDYDHPMTQDMIIKRLEDDYGIVLERKAIGKNISELREAGFDICSRREGCYLESRDFEDSELKLLIDAVLQSRYITAKQSKDLIERLSALSNIYFRSHIKNVYSVNEWSKTENQALFLNIELIGEAILSGKQIQYDYNKYGIDGKLHKTKTHCISPYQLVLHNQRYYLMGQSERWKNMAFHRLDHITNMEILDAPITPITTIKGYENGVDYKKLSSTLPYMYTDEPERVSLKVDDYIVDQIVDWFGTDVKMTEISGEDNKVRVDLIVSPNAMEHWVLQYTAHVEVISPVSLRERVKKVLSDALDKYNK